MIGRFVLLLHLGLAFANPPRIQIPRQRTIHIPYPVDRPVPVPVPVTRRIYVPSPPQHVPTYIHHFVTSQPRVIFYRHPVHGITGLYQQGSVSGAIPMGGISSGQVFGQGTGGFSGVGGIGHSVYPVGPGQRHMGTGFHGQGSTFVGQGGFGGIFNSVSNIGGGFRGVSLGPSMTAGGAGMGGAGMGGGISVGGSARGAVGAGMGGGMSVAGGAGGAGAGFTGTNTNAFNLAQARSMIQSGNTGGVASNNGIFRVVHNSVRFLGNGANVGAGSGGAGSGGQREFEGNGGLAVNLGGLIRGFVGSSVGGHSSSSGSGGGVGGSGGGVAHGGDSNGNGYYRSFWSHFDDDDDD